jgi:hypothetical protein
VSRVRVRCAADRSSAALGKGMACYEFANDFYLPESEAPRFDEGFARLDHAQSVFASHLTDHRGLRLTSDAHDALVEWSIAFSTQREMEGSLIREYREAMLADSGNE